MIKAAEWRAVAKRAIAAVPDEWLRSKRMIYRPTGRWLVQGVLADSTQWVRGQTLWRLCVVPVHDYDGLSLDWSVRLGIREDSVDSIAQVEDEIKATLLDLPSEEAELQRIASSAKPTGRRADLTRACANFNTGRSGFFRDLIFAPPLGELTAQELAIPGLAEQYEPQFQRVRQLRKVAEPKAVRRNQDDCGRGRESPGSRQG